MHVLNDGELMPKALYQAIHGVVVILNDGESLNSTCDASFMFHSKVNGETQSAASLLYFLSLYIYIYVLPPRW
jgi:hypothetical protein